MFTNAISLTIKANTGIAKIAVIGLDWSTDKVGGKDKSVYGGSPV